MSIAQKHYQVGYSLYMGGHSLRTSRTIGSARVGGTPSTPMAECSTPRLHGEGLFLNMSYLSQLDLAHPAPERHGWRKGDSPEGGEVKAPSRYTSSAGTIVRTRNRNGRPPPWVDPNEPLSYSVYLTRRNKPSNMKITSKIEISGERGNRNE